MVTQPQTTSLLEVVYPESDGKPMADNTEQFGWILVIEQNIAWMFANDSRVFVAGDLLWFPVEGNNALSAAPDTMVVFGRPKGRRGSYRQWLEDNIAPQVVFEIRSPSNTAREMETKFEFYDTYGVEEYYLYDPSNNRLQGWLRSSDRGQLEPIATMQGWVSPRLGIWFELGASLQLYRPDGTPFFSFEEVSQRLEEERQRVAEERQRADEERQRADEERQRANEERQRADRLAEKLREMGIDPDAI